MFLVPLLMSAGLSEAVAVTVSRVTEVGLVVWSFID